jgi:hypothetical protein
MLCPDKQEPLLRQSGVPPIFRPGLLLLMQLALAGDVALVPST